MTVMSSKSSYSGQIAVIGMGCWYPGANNLRQLWENILARRQQFRRTPDRRLPLSEYYDPDPTAPDKTYGSRMAVIDEFEFDWASKRIPKTVVDTADIAHWLALEVVMKAIEDAGYKRETIPTQRTGVLLGNTLTGEFSRSTNLRMRWPYVRRVLMAAAEAKGVSLQVATSLAQTMEEYYKSVFSPITEDTLSGNLSNTIAGRICNFFNFHGGGYTVDGACSSSLIAVANAATALVNGDLDLALAGGVDISLDTFELIGFAKTGALTSKDMTVYDRKASGFIPGEGCGFVVLKRLEDARVERNYVYAVLKGWGISSDGKGGLTAPNHHGQATALRRAYDRAGYSPRTLDFIEGHGTGTPVGDRTELEGITLAMGSEDGMLPRSCGITSLKSIVGHTKAAAGVGAFIKAVMAINRRILPPTSGCKEPNTVFESSARCLYPILQGEVRSKTDILRAGVSAMGFGGINCHVTLESGDAPAPHLKPSIAERSLLVSNEEIEIFILTATSISRLLQRTQTIMSMAEGISVCELTDLAAHLSQGLEPDLPVRAALVASTSDELIKRLKLLEKLLLEAPPAVGEVIASPQKEIWVGNGMRKNRIGFLFPGQGSQRLNMARTLVERFSWAHSLVEQADNWLCEAGYQKVSQFIYRSLDRAISQEQSEQWSKELASTEISQPAICLASLLWMLYLNRLGIKPVAVGGHSLGELSAFYAAGAFDEKTLLCLAAMRGQVMSASQNSDKSGAMVSLACSFETAEYLLKQVSGYAVIANINSPRQIVVSGEQASVEQVIELAKAKRIQTRQLSVSNGFHSQLVCAAVDRLKEYKLIPEKLEQTTVDLFSSVDGQQVADGKKVREHFAHQVVAPVDFISLVKALTLHCDLLVEVGPGNVLSGLVRDIIGSDKPNCFSVESKPGLDRDLKTMLSAVFVHGCEIEWKALYENRLVHPFIPVSERTFIENPLERPFQVSKPSTPLTVGVSEVSSQMVPSEQAQVTWAMLSNYLAQRATFLTEIIRADLQTLPLLAAASNGKNGSQEVQPVLVSHASIPKVHESGTIANETAEPQTAFPVETFLINLIARQTGFASDSITPQTRLLDDLNLDSIKAGELIANAAKEFDVAGKIDPAPLANAKIQEIAEAIRVLVADNSTTSQIAEASTLIELNKLRNGSTSAANGVSRNRVNSANSLTLSSDAKRKVLVRDFIVRAVEEELPLVSSEGDIEENWQAANALIICEESSLDVAKAVFEKLYTQGARVQVTSFAEARNHALTQSADFTHFFAVLPCIPNIQSSSEILILDAIKRLNSLTTIPTDQKAGQRKTVVYIQFGGGHFGIQSQVAHIEQCSAVSFAASLHLERPDLKVRVLDFSISINPASLAECLLTELSTQDAYMAVGYDDQLTRRVPRPYLQEPAEYCNRGISWTSNDVILVTGGAKGVTAECAIALARCTGAQMVLLGRSPHPERERGRSSAETANTLERFQAEGLRCAYYTCDVSNFDSVSFVLQTIRQELGEITGVIHGAAVNIPRRAEQVSAEVAFDEISPKLLGVMNLLRALQNTELKLFAALSSVIGVTGMQRNAWYAFSNEAMDLLLRGYKNQHSQTAVLSVAYSVWEEVGMGARMGSVRNLSKMGIGAIPKDEGVSRFLRLVKNDPGDCQIVVVAAMRAMSAFEKGGFDTWNPRLFPLPAASRFLEKIVVNEPGVEVISRAHLTIERDLYLQDHVYKGSHLFPTVFGLEAMAQAVAYATGEHFFSTLRIENICLERPIVVDPNIGVDIEIHAEVTERESKNATRRVYAAIKTEQTGFAINHFSATFVLGIEGQPPKKQLNIPAVPLDIEPQKDLYSWLLFQGPLFQRLKQIYSLDSRQFTFGTEICALSSTGKDSFADEKAMPLLLGDPYFRDSLLQSAQVAIPKDLCLPVRIDSIEIYQCKRDFSEICIGVMTPQSIEKQDYKSSVFAVDNSGYIIEKLDGYVTRLLERCEDNPTAEEIANPGQRDELILRNQLNEQAKQFNLVAPEISLAYLPGLHLLSKEERHQRELPLLHKVVSLALHDCNDFTDKVQFKWNEHGKPVIELKEESELDISLSHDNQVCICVVGQKPQGCDIEPIVQRTWPDWIGLLSDTHKPVLQQLIDSKDTLARAGTRIWTSAEALRKAVNITEISLQIRSQNGDTVLFSCFAGNHWLHVLSFPLKLTRGGERMVACIVQKRS